MCLDIDVVALALSLSLTLTSSSNGVDNDPAAIWNGDTNGRLARMLYTYDVAKLGKGMSLHPPLNCLSLTRHPFSVEIILRFSIKHTAKLNTDTICSVHCTDDHLLCSLCAERVSEFHSILSAISNIISNAFGVSCALHTPARVDTPPPPDTGIIANIFN